MNAVLGYVLMVPAAWFGRHSTMADWQPFTSIDSRVRFEMPGPPQERVFEGPDGGKCHIFTLMQEDLIFEAVAMDMPEEVQLGLKEAVSDSEVSVTREILNDSVQQFIEAGKAGHAKITASEYVRFKKLPARACTVTLDGYREAKMMSAVGKAHAYMFIVSYSRVGNGPAAAKRFFDSITFQN